VCGCRVCDLELNLRAVQQCQECCEEWRLYVYRVSLLKLITSGNVYKAVIHRAQAPSDIALKESSN
jgi:hypothetical protein